MSWHGWSLLRPTVHAAIATRFVAPRRAGVQVCDLFRCFVVSFRSAVIGRDSPRPIILNCRNAKEGLCTARFAIAGGLSCLRFWARPPETIRRPGAGRGPGPLILAVRFSGCLRLAVIGRVSPRRATIFLVATRKMDKEAPPAAAPALAGALAPPASGGSRRNSPWRAQTSTRQFPPATRSSRRCRRGKRCRLGFAIAGRLSCRVASSGTAFGHDSSPRRRPGSRLFDPCCSVLGLPSVGACWPGLAPKRSALPSCAV